jgi:hypothetical protein
MEASEDLNRQDTQRLTKSLGTAKDRRVSMQRLDIN